MRRSGADALSSRSVPRSSRARGSVPLAAGARTGRGVLAGGASANVPSGRSTISRVGQYSRDHFDREHRGHSRHGHRYRHGHHDHHGHIYFGHDYFGFGFGFGHRRHYGYYRHGYHYDYPYWYGGYPVYGFYSSHFYPWYWGYRHRYGYVGASLGHGFYLGYGVYRPLAWAPFWGVGLATTYVETPVIVREEVRGYPYEDVDVERAERELEEEEALPEANRKLGPGGIEKIDEAESETSLPKPSGAEEEFLASLEASKLSFAVGLLHFREGRYQYATEAFYNSTTEDPQDRLAKVFLAHSLFAIGEFGYAAEYFRQGLDGYEEFPRYEWTIAPLYELSPEKLAEQRAVLAAELASRPEDSDLLLVDAAVRWTVGDVVGAAKSFDLARSVAGHEATNRIADAFVAEVERRVGVADALEDSDAVVASNGTAAFLSRLDLSSVRDLP